MGEGNAAKGFRQRILATLWRLKLIVQKVSFVVRILVACCPKTQAIRYVTIRSSSPTRFRTNRETFHSIIAPFAERFIKRTVLFLSHPIRKIYKATSLLNYRVVNIEIHRLLLTTR